MDSIFTERETILEHTALAPCEWCGGKHEYRMQQIRLERIGTLCYSVCCGACNVAHRDLLVSRLSTANRRPAHLTTIIKQEVQIAELKKIIGMWEDFASRILRVPERYRTMQQRLEKRTDVLLGRTKEGVH